MEDVYVLAAVVWFFSDHILAHILRMFKVLAVDQIKFESSVRILIMVRWTIFKTTNFCV